MIRVARIELDDPRFEEVSALDRELLGEAPPTSETDWWVAWDHEANALAGYAGARILSDGSWYLSRAGVVPSYRGQGLQRRLIRARVRRGQQLGCTTIATYTMPHNHASANNLIDEGFRTYLPAQLYAGSDVVYWLHRGKRRRGM